MQPLKRRRRPGLTGIRVTCPRLAWWPLPADRVIGWAALSPVSSRAVYAGVAETSVYIAGRLARQGSRPRIVGIAHRRIREASAFGLCRPASFRKMLPALALHQSCGFRVVGTRERIAQLDGVWRDTLLLERRSLLLAVIEQSENEPDFSRKIRIEIKRFVA